VRARWILSLLLAASACAQAPARGESKRPAARARSIEVPLDGSLATLVDALPATPPADARARGEEPRRAAGDLEKLRAALEQAAPRVRRWGGFRAPLEIRLLPDHPALEAASGQPGVPWLRAWSWSDRVLVQSPRSWEGAAEADEATLAAALAELLAHELTHALMYQRLARGDGAPVEEPPLWFREGMASLTAGQGARRLSSQELAGWVAQHPDAPLLAPTDALMRASQPAIYAAAHRAFERLASACGDAVVLALLDDLRGGANFERAFQQRTGLSLGQFAGRGLAVGFAPALSPALCAPR